MYLHNYILVTYILVEVNWKVEFIWDRKFFWLTLQAPIPQNGQIHSNNLSATVDKLFECV